MERYTLRDAAPLLDSAGRALLLMAFLLAVLLAPKAAFAMDGIAVEVDQLEVISKPATGGATANFFSQHPRVDASGDVIVFSSPANDLVAGDTGPLNDVFIYTRETGGLTNITLGANDNSGLPEISADGRYVAFISAASNLRDDDANGNLPNVFLFDRQTEELQLGPAMSDTPFHSTNFNVPRLYDVLGVSADGTVVAVRSSAANLVLGGPADGTTHLYLWEPGTNRVRGIALQSEAGIFDVDLSDDGRFVVFSSDARDVLDSPFTERQPRLYLYDVEQERIEVLLDGRQGVWPSISADGEHVAFSGRERDFISGADSGYSSRIFSVDTRSGQITLVSKDIPNPPPVNEEAEAGSDSIAISGDGMRIAFVSRDTNLAPGDNNGAADIFLWDRSTEQITRITAGANRESDSPAIDSTGDTLVFSSAATNLVSVADNNGFRDIFAWRREGGSPPPECEPSPSGVLASSSGVSVNLQGTSTCFGSGLYSYGTPDSDGIHIPATRGRPELRLVPVNPSGLPANDLVFFRYTSTSGQDLYATDFVARDSGYSVHMTFKAIDPEAFELYELVVFEPGQQSRRSVIYREQDTQWQFTPQDVGDVLNISATLFRDQDDNARRSADERGVGGREMVLYRCGNQDGLAGTLRTGPEGVVTFSTLEPGFYQLAVNISRFVRFSSASFDSAGNLINPIKAVVPTDQGSTGYTACTDFTDGNRAFEPVGVLSNQ